MADRREVKNNIRQLQRVKTWQLILLFLLACFISATFLRLNNIGMVERRNAVISADEKGDEQAIISRLYDLQRYVSSHMNTDMGGGMYLEASYKRDAQAAYDEAAVDSNPNGNIYKKAQDVCAPQFSRYSYQYLQCTTGELAKYPSASDLVASIKAPKADSYKHDFVSPVWSTDFAGWSVLVTALIGLMILARLVSLLVLRALLKKHYQNI